MKKNPLPTDTFIIHTSSARTSSRFGRYGNVAVLRVRAGVSGVSSTRAKEVVSVPWERRKLNMGKTQACAYQVALADAQHVASELLGELHQGQLG